MEREAAGTLQRRAIPRLALAVIAPVVATGAALLYLFDPTTAHFFPPCPLRAITGFQCPGCGTTRALHALLHGQFAAAFAFNPMLFVMSAAIAPALITFARGRTPRYVTQPWFAWCAAIVICAWWIGRNVFGI